MPKLKTTTPPDYDVIYAQLLTQLGSPTEIETPALGRVVFPRPSELRMALDLVRQEQARASGTAGAGVFVVGYNRGLGPQGEC
jgi:hypothetical protein